MILVTVTLKHSMVGGAVEVNEIISRGVYCNCIWAFSSGSNTNARVTCVTHGNAARKDWETRKLMMERWVMPESGADEERSKGGTKEILTSEKGSSDKEK